mgnify:CR=1 FL=1
MKKNKKRQTRLGDRVNFRKLHPLCMELARQRRSSSATSTDGLMTSIDLPGLSGRDVSALVKNIEDTRQRLKELEAELEVRRLRSFSSYDSRK